MDTPALDPVDTRAAAIVYRRIFDAYCPNGHIPGSGHPGDHEDEQEPDDA